MRRHDWEARLIDYIGAREQRPFEWGPRANDCCSFGAGGVLATTDRDVMADVPHYDTAKGAAALLAKPLTEWLDERFERRPKGLARRGDIATALNKDGREVVMIVEGETLVGPGLQRLERLPRSEMRAAWAV